MPTVIDRARKTLTALPAAVPFRANEHHVIVPGSPAGFTVTLQALGPRRFRVTYDGWSQTFDRAEDAYDCFEYGLSDSCRLRVTYRGNEAVAWQIEKREYGLWMPGRRVARRLVPFWRRQRVEHRQNRVFVGSRSSEPGPEA